MSMNELRSRVDDTMNRKSNGGREIAAEMSQQQFRRGLKDGQVGRKSQGKSAAYRAGFAIGAKSLLLRDGSAR